jgi:cyclopropane fatty-acyl-phospholipid synthase-like methyltransferase
MRWPFRGAPPVAEQLEKMRADWDRRARENARHFIATGREQWTDEEFFESGVRTVEEEILTDMSNVCQGKAPREMRVLEIGCGAGRITRALAEVFGEVHGVDVSGEMVERARVALQAFPHAHVYRNNGMDLTVVPDLPFDFAFSYIVFQHIANYEIVENYVREVSRLLRPAGLFKFQVLGGVSQRRGSRFSFRRGTNRPDPNDTWKGAQFTEEAALAMAERCGFECRFQVGAEDQYFWLWFFKVAEPPE